MIWKGGQAGKKLCLGNQSGFGFWWVSWKKWWVGFERCRESNKVQLTRVGLVNDKVWGIGVHYLNSC